MPNEMNRRNFLKAGLALAGTAGAAAGGMILPQAVMASGGGELCTVLDLDKCIGCEACVDACRDTWQAGVPDPVDPIPQPFPERVPIEDWSGRKDVRDRLTPYNFLYVEHLDFQYKGSSRELHVPRRCMHCTNPPCANLCPFGAGRVERNGVVHLDPDICLGGAKCKQVCPWHIPQRQSGVGLYLDVAPSLAGNGVMFKCHRCLPLLKEGKQPRCVEVCPVEAQSIGPREEMLRLAEGLAREKAVADGAGPEAWRDYVYGLEENGGTNTLYVSPIPKAELARAVAGNQAQDVAHNAAQAGGRGRGGGAKVSGGRRMGRGNRGRPPMGPVADSMAGEENLTLALVTAPLAGAAAGLLGLWSKVKAFTGPDRRKAEAKHEQGGEA